MRQDTRVAAAAATDPRGHINALQKIGGKVVYQARAAAVVKSLGAEHGIQADRLKPYGAGPYCPVATNQTEEGRSQNRRVELVQQ